MYQFHPHFFSDVRIEESHITHYQFMNDEIDNYIQRKREGAFLRVFDGQKWYYSVTTDLSAIQVELDKLYAMGTPNTDIAQHPLVKKLPSHTVTNLKFENEKAYEIPADTKLEYLKRYMPMFQNNEYLLMLQSFYVDKYVKKHIYNSKGADVQTDWQLCGIMYNMHLRHGEKVFQNAIQKANPFFTKLQMCQNCIDEFQETSNDMLLNAKTVEPGVYKVIMAPRVAGVFAHESFGHKSEADFMLGDENMKKEWQLGKQVGSPILSIVDDGCVDGAGYIGFDDEGCPALKTDLIRNGILAGRLHSSETSVSLEEETTGNARAINFEYEPIVRMTCTYIEPGNLTKEELFAKVDKGIYIKEIKHGSGMSTFTLAPRVAYYIENGKIKHPVDISVVTGSVFETLGKIEALSDTLEISSFVLGGCGKNVQMGLPVSFGGPYVLVSELNVQ